MLREPLDPPAARRLILEIIAKGGTIISRHAFEEMENDGLNGPDVSNVLRGGVVEPAELVNATWRYRVRTRRMVVVVAFDSQDELRVVTAWRIKT